MLYHLLISSYIDNQQPSGSMIEEEDTTRQPFCTVFLFINSGSGGGLGTKIIKQEITEISFDVPIDNEKDIKPIDVYFINMKRNRQYGFRTLKKLTDKNKKTIAIVCGGDGTVMWVVECFVEYDIDPMKVPIGIIPLGTGNDFSRNLNWGGEKTALLENNYRSLKKLIRKWLHAKERQFDLWDVRAEVYEYGKLQKVQNFKNSLMEGTILQKTFCNYFSFGIDGKVGYSFDMHRTKSRLGNLAVYGMLGIVKAATKTKTIDELIQSFWISPKAEDEVKHCQDGNCVFKSVLKGSKVKMKQQTENITPGLVNILFLNIDSYTGGVKGIWNSAKEIFQNNVGKRDQPSFSDGKIEIVSFGSGPGIAMERSFGGFASRIAQHEGPFRFNFHQYPQNEKHRTYLQIDGEFIRFTHPKTIVVGKSKMVKNGKIKVLENDPNFVPYTPQP